MSFLQVSGCKVRSWHGELPPAIYDAYQSAEISFEASAPSSDQERRAAVELHQLRSRLHYGLLGATLSPSDTPTLEIKLLTSADRLEQRFTDTLAHKFENIYVGLPHEYANSIIRGVSEAIGRLKEIHAGKILFNCAAHSLVGSSEAVFHRLSIAVINMLSFPEEDTSLLKELCKPI